LLDTCALSEKLRKRPNARFVKWLEARDVDELFISAISVGEIRKGIDLLPGSSKKERLDAWFSEDLLPFFEGRILEVDCAAGLEWGRRFARCQLDGTKPPVIDSLIGVTALVHGLTVVTRNEEDFVRFGAEVLNPW
jgi:predicted nucleic acid-binding protein